MSISVDTVNLRFNVKPDYDQQQLQQLQQDLKDGQRELEKTRKAMDKLSKNGLSAMTKEEREDPSLLNASRRKRIATGCGQPVSAVNNLIKKYEEARKMMKMMAGGGKKSKQMQRMMRGMGM